MIQAIRQRPREAGALLLLSCEYPARCALDAKRVAAQGILRALTTSSEGRSMSKDIRSAIFREAAGVREEFTEHLSHIWAMSAEQQEHLLESFPTIVKAETGTEQAIAQQKIVEQVGGEARKTLQAINVLHYIYQKWDPLRDDSKSVRKELKDLDFLPEDDTGAEKFLTKFFAFIEEDSSRRQRKAVTEAILPSLVGIMAVVEHRAVFDGRFDWARDELEMYSPTCTGHVTTTLIKIMLSKEKEPLIFQCDANHLKLVVKQLQAALKEVESSERVLRDGAREQES